MQNQLNIPDFKKNETVDIREEDVSEESEELDDNDQRDKAKKENYDKIKDRLKRQKFSK